MKMAENSGTALSSLQSVASKTPLFWSGPLKQFMFNSELASYINVISKCRFRKWQWFNLQTNNQQHFDLALDHTYPTL